jgi:hypothetical protein
VRASALEDEASAANLQAAKAANPTGGFGLRKTHVFRYGGEFRPRSERRRQTSIKGQKIGLQVRGLMKIEESEWALA